MALASVVRISCFLVISILEPVSAINIVLSSVTNISAATSLVVASCIDAGTLLLPLSYVTLIE